jgi:hypothetical protein
VENTYAIVTDDKRCPRGERDLVTQVPSFRPMEVARRINPEEREKGNGYARCEEVKKKMFFRSS